MLPDRMDEALQPRRSRRPHCEVVGIQLASPVPLHRCRAHPDSCPLRQLRRAQLVQDGIDEHCVEQRGQGTALGHPPLNRERLGEGSPHPNAAAGRSIHAVDDSEGLARDALPEQAVEQQVVWHRVVRLFRIKEAHVCALLAGVPLLCDVDHVVERIQHPSAWAEGVLLVVQFHLPQQAAREEYREQFVNARHDGERPVVATVARVPAFVSVGDHPLAPRRRDAPTVVHRIE